VVLATFAAAPCVAEPAPFYAGKTISLSTFTPPGGSYDTYLRLLSRHMGRYLPGEPKFVVVNQPGAGGILALNYAATSAPKDGTFLTLVGVGMFTQEALVGGLPVSLGKFNWIGNFSSVINVLVTSGESKARSIEDARRREVLLGSVGAGSIDAQLPNAANFLAKTRFKILYGYKGNSEVLLAMERGEVEGRVNSWASLKAQMEPARLQKLNVLLQYGIKKAPDLPNVPLLSDIAGKSADNQAVAKFIGQSLAMSRPLAAPPDVPADRIEILRRAFDKTMADPEFLAEAKKTGFDIDPTQGEEVQTAVTEFLATPAPIIALAKRALKLDAR
jgi:tripartite-type tricarboxylate transporter receptor subunit TctC